MGIIKNRILPHKNIKNETKSDNKNIKKACKWRVKWLYYINSESMVIRMLLKKENKMAIYRKEMDEMTGTQLRVIVKDMVKMCMKAANESFANPRASFAADNDTAGRAGYSVVIQLNKQVAYRFKAVLVKRIKAGFIHLTRSIEFNGDCVDMWRDAEPHDNGAITSVREGLEYAFNFAESGSYDYPDNTWQSAPKRRGRHSGAIKTCKVILGRVFYPKGTNGSVKGEWRYGAVLLDYTDPWDGRFYEAYSVCGWFNDGEFCLRSHLENLRPIPAGGPKYNALMQYLTERYVESPEFVDIEPFRSQYLSSVIHGSLNDISFVQFDRCGTVDGPFIHHDSYYRDWDGRNHGEGRGQRMDCMGIKGVDSAGVLHCERERNGKVVWERYTCPEHLRDQFPRMLSVRKAVNPMIGHNSRGVALAA